MAAIQPPRFTAEDADRAYDEWGANCGPGALAAGKRCIVIGWRENVFHCLPEVEFFESWDDCLSALQTGGET